MIAFDSSVVVRFLNGIEHPACDTFDRALEDGTARIPPAVVSEVLSAVSIAPEIADWVATLPVMPLEPGYWIRVGQLRSALRRHGRKAALGDALIAQCCLDANLPLLTLDSDFRAFAEFGGLKLVAL